MELKPAVPLLSFDEGRKVLSEWSCYLSLTQSHTSQHCLVQEEEYGRAVTDNFIFIFFFSMCSELPGGCHLSWASLCPIFTLLFLPFLTPWCLSKFNSGHRGSSNSKLKYTNLSHLQSITEADTGMCNLIDCFPPSLLMKSSPELLHPSPCSSQQTVNYLQKKLQYFCISDIDSVCDLDKQRLNTSVFQPVK